MGVHHFSLRTDICGNTVAIMFCFGLTAPNFGSMAMEPVGHIAGAASSVQGCITTVGAAVLGFMIGQLFNSSSFLHRAGNAENTLRYQGVSSLC